MKNRKNKIYSFLILFVVFSISIFINPADASAECSIQSATFTPSGNQSDNWFKDDAAPSVQLKVTGNSECAGKTAEVSIVEDDTVGVDDDVAGIDDLNVIFPVSNTFTINLKAGETDCEQWTGNDCEYYIKIDLTDADNFSGGKLEYDCDGLCNTDWVVGKIDRPGGDASKETAPTCKEGEEIKDGKCVPIDPNYYLLAPLPCQAGSSEGCIQNPDGSYTLQKFDPRGEGGGNLGKYLNIMIRIFIGICAVLAVMMIVVGGIEYMTSELMSTKEQGRHKISGAIFGLLLALGAWTLLNQINPDLLNTELKSLTDQVVEVDLAKEGVLANENAPAPSGNLEAWAKQYGKVLKMTLNDGSVIDLKPCDGSNIVRYNAFGTSFQLNKYLYNSINRLNGKWQTSYKNYPMASAGGYVCKVILGKDGKPTKYVSFHSYGIAVDFNSAKNGRGTKGDMPAGFVSEWKKEGWSWGGDWAWTDPMHFGMGESGGNIRGEK